MQHDIIISSCSTSSSTGAAHDERRFIDELYKHLNAQSSLISVYSCSNRHNLSPIDFYDAVTRSRVAVAVITDEYVCSRMSMLELWTICLVEQAHPSVKVLPVFYKLSPVGLKDQFNLQRWRQTWTAHTSQTDLDSLSQDVLMWQEITLHMLSAYNYTSLFFDPSEGEDSYLERIVSTVRELVHSAQQSQFKSSEITDPRLTARSDQHRAIISSLAAFTYFVPLLAIFVRLLIFFPVLAIVCGVLGIGITLLLHYLYYNQLSATDLRLTISVLALALANFFVFDVFPIPSMKIVITWTDLVVITVGLPLYWAEKLPMTKARAMIKSGNKYASFVVKDDDFLTRVQLAIVQGLNAWVMQPCKKLKLKMLGKGCKDAVDGTGPSTSKDKDVTKFGTKLQMIEGNEPHEMILRIKVQLNNTSAIPILVHYFQVAGDKIEFYFSNEKEMASCIGVGLPHSKVVLSADLSISIHEMDHGEWGRQQIDLYASSLRDKTTCQLVIDFAHLNHHNQSRNDEFNEDVVSSSDMSKLYGVGLDGVNHHVSTYEKMSYQGKGMMWPLLYDIALLMLRKVSNNKQCSNETNCSDDKEMAGSSQSGDSSHGNGGGSFLRRLSKRCSQSQGNGNDNQEDAGDGDGGKEDAGDGDGNGGEDGPDETNDRKQDDCDPPQELRVKVYALPKIYFFKPGERDQVKCWKGLEAASIVVLLVLDFYKSQQRKDIKISATSRLQLDTKRQVRQDSNKFGWYHNDIDIALGNCKQSGILEQYSIVGCVVEENYKMGSMESTTSSIAGTLSASGQIGFNNMCKLSLGGFGNKQETTNRQDTIERSPRSICEGFFPQDSSSAACAKFTLVYPLESENRPDILCSRKFRFKAEGLCSTINPCIKGTWLPLDDSEDSPYELTIERDLKLLKMKKHAETLVCKQQFLLMLRVNHAMSHLQRHPGPEIELKSKKPKEQVSGVLEIINLTDGPLKQVTLRDEPSKVIYNLS